VRIIYTLVKLFSKLFFGFWGNLKIAGEANIPRTGPVIVVANHISLLDGFLLVAFWPRRITFLSAAYLFKMRAVGAFLRAIGAIPVQNGMGQAGLKQALSVLQSGDTLGIFPEGRVCQLDNLYPFKTGWAYLALKSGAPVLPVVISSNISSLPKGAVFPRRRKIVVQISEPWAIEKIHHPQKETVAAMNMRLIKQMENTLSNVQDIIGGVIKWEKDNKVKHGL